MATARCWSRSARSEAVGGTIAHLRCLTFLCDGQPPMIMSRSLAIVLLCVLAHAAQAATLERLRTFVHQTQTARASFTQVVTDRNGRVKQEASGEFAISRPGKFRWSVAKPYQQLLVGDGER